MQAISTKLSPQGVEIVSNSCQKIVWEVIIFFLANTVANQNDTEGDRKQAFNFVTATFEIVTGAPKGARLNLILFPGFGVGHQRSCRSLDP
jgi:hypothetical protein